MVAINTLINLVKYVVSKYEFILIFIKYRSIYTIDKKTLLYAIKNYLHGLDNFINISGNKATKIKFFIKGNSNLINIRGDISISLISMSGNNNQFLVESDCILTGLNIVIRGNDCIIKISKNTTIGGARIVCMGAFNSIEIGEDCQFSDRIEIWATDSHPIYNENGYLINQSKPILIGNHVWLGSNVTILKGVSIDDNAIVGISSLVTKNIIANSINAGNPSKLIKENVSWNRSFIED